MGGGEIINISSLKKIGVKDLLNNLFGHNLEGDTPTTITGNEVL